MLNKITEHKLIEGANSLLDYASSLFTMEEMIKFQTQYSALVHEYQNTPSLSILSTGIHIDRLESFQNWKSELISNKDKVIPLIVSNMLRGDIFAASIYNEIYKDSTKDDFIITYSHVHKDKKLESSFLNYGAAEDSLSILNAEHWLTTKEAAEMFQIHSSSEALCYIDELLNIQNEFIHC